MNLPHRVGVGARLFGLDDLSCFIDFGPEIFLIGQQLVVVDDRLVQQQLDDSAGVGLAVGVVGQFGPNEIADKLFSLLAGQKLELHGVFLPLAVAVIWLVVAASSAVLTAVVATVALVSASAAVAAATEGIAAPIAVVFLPLVWLLLLRRLRLLAGAAAAASSVLLLELLLSRDVSVLTAEGGQERGNLAELLLVLLFFAVFPVLEEIDFEGLLLLAERRRLVKHLDALLRVLDVVVEHVRVPVSYTHLTLPTILRV